MKIEDIDTNFKPATVGDKEVHYLDAKSNYPTLGIDNLTVSWECAWPRQTVIYLQ